MSSLPAEGPAGAARSIIYLGMDVHKDSLTVAELPGDAKASSRVERLPMSFRCHVAPRSCCTSRCGRQCSRRLIPAQTYQRQR
jgi:hypothetical protein